MKAIRPTSAVTLARGRRRARIESSRWSTSSAVPSITEFDMRSATFGFLLIVGCVAGFPAYAAQTSDAALRAGFARADITPDPRMLNWTQVPARPYGEVHDPLFVRVLVISDGQTRIALIG